MGQRWPVGIHLLLTGVSSGMRASGSLRPNIGHWQRSIGKKLGPEATTQGRRFSSNPAKCP